MHRSKIIVRDFKSARDAYEYGGTYKNTKIGMEGISGKFVCRQVDKEKKMADVVQKSEKNPWVEIFTNKALIRILEIIIENLLDSFKQKGIDISPILKMADPIYVEQLITKTFSGPSSKALGDVLKVLIDIKTAIDVSNSSIMQLGNKVDILVKIEQKMNEISVKADTVNEKMEAGAFKPEQFQETMKKGVSSGIIEGLPSALTGSLLRLNLDLKGKINTGKI